MRIISLTAENVKKLKAVHIVPDNNVVLVTGKNGAGKTSVLDSILYALGGAKELPDKPIREGEEKANIVLELDDIIITRTFTEKGSYLDVRNKEGFRSPSPQAMLDKLIGRVSFDPLSFINESDSKKQRKILLDLAGLDFTQTDKQIAELREARKLIGFEHNRVKVTLELKKVPEGLPEKEIDIGALNDELEKTNKHNQTIEREKQQLEIANLNLRATTNVIAKNEERVNEIHQQIELLKKDAERLSELLIKDRQIQKDEQDTVDTLQKTIDNFIPFTTTTIKEQIQKAQETNKLIYKARERKDLETVFAEKAKEYDQKTKELEALEAEKKTKLLSTPMPVEGLSVSEDGVIYNGIPLKQASSAEQLKVGIAVSMALNPKLRVLRILNGSLLDSSNLEVISQMVKDKDYQVWIEKVDETGQVGLFIEDGELKNQSPVTENGSL